MMSSCERQYFPDGKQQASKSLFILLIYYNIHQNHYIEVFMCPCVLWNIAHFSVRHKQLYENLISMSLFREGLVSAVQMFKFSG